MQAAAVRERRRLLELELPVSVEIGRLRMTLGQVLRLPRGAVLELGRPVDQPLELRVSGKLIGKGQAVRVGDRLGLRVTEILTPAQRVRTLGGSDGRAGGRNFRSGDGQGVEEGTTAPAEAAQAQGSAAAAAAG